MVGASVTREIMQRKNAMQFYEIASLCANVPLLSTLLQFSTKEDTTGGSQLGAALTDDGYSDFDGWQLNPIETILQQVRLLLYQAVIVSRVKLFERPNQMLHITLASSPW